MNTESDNTTDRQFDTRCVHAGEPLDDRGGMFPPLYNHSTFGFSSTEELKSVIGGRQEGNLYTRYGQNPTVRALEDKLADLEGGEAALAFGSGIAAEAATIMALCGNEDHVVCIGDVYGGTYDLLDEHLRTRGIEPRFLPDADPGRLEERIEDRTRVVFFETPTNPKMEILDIGAIGEIARQHGAVTVVDNTFATPVHQNPLAEGADLTIHSATKYLGGHSDLTAGAVMGPADLLEPIGRWRKNLGQMIAPEVAFLLARSLRTLPVRVRAQTRRAQAIAEFLRDHPRVLDVNYPGLPEAEGHELASRQMRGFGAMISFRYDGDTDQAAAVADRLEIFTIAPSLGGIESLVTQPVTTTHYDMDPRARRRRGITGDMLRLSVGLEGTEDLINDLDRALD